MPVVTPHRLGDFTLGHAAPLAHVGEPVCADLGDEPGRAALDVLATDCLDVLVADGGPAHGAHGGGFFGGSFFQRTPPMSDASSKACSPTGSWVAGAR